VIAAIPFDRRDKLGRRRWYFRLVAAENGETLTQSEAYNSAQARDHTAERLTRDRIVIRREA
jgi:uncharacterized protein YegP (UPF0339 family)